MRRAATRLATVTLLGIGIGCGDTQRAPVEQLPPPVREAARAHANGGVVRHVELDEEDGVTTYELEVVAGEQVRHLSLSPSGELLEEELTVAVASLPRSVTDAARRSHPNSRLRSAELVKAGGATYYELKLMDGRARYEIKVTPQGRVIPPTPQDD